MNIENAGLASKVTILVGAATEILPKINSTFDMAFIDADKQSNVEYFMHAQRLVKNGGIIIVDNVVRNGRVADLDQNDASIEGVRRLLQHIQQNATVEATTLATVGEKGYDGFLYAINKL
jgi:predicted O-methyltransferase YrrM